MSFSITRAKGCCCTLYVIPGMLYNLLGRYSSIQRQTTATTLCMVFIDPEAARKKYTDEAEHETKMRENIYSQDVTNYHDVLSPSDIQYRFRYFVYSIAHGDAHFVLVLIVFKGCGKKRGAHKWVHGET